MKTLEKLLRIGCSGLISLGLVGKTNNVRAADVLDYVEPNSLKIVASADPQAMGKATISKYWIAWEKDGTIYAKDRIKLADSNSTNDPEILIASGGAKNPNLDSVNGNKLVYDKAGAIYLKDLKNNLTETVYSNLPFEFCSNPKMNGDNVVFIIHSGLLGEEFGWVVQHDMKGPPEEYVPISSSLNKKSQPDTYGNYVVWTEEDINYPPGQKMFSSRIYDLVNHAEIMRVNDVSSIAIYDANVMGVQNSRSWDNGPTSLISYYLGNEPEKSGGVSYGGFGKKTNVAMCGNLMVWEEPAEGYIKGVDINSKMSINQFTIAGPGCYNPDVYVDVNDPNIYNVIYMTNNGPIVNQTQPLSNFIAMSEDIPSTPEPNSYLMQATIKPYERKDMKKCGDRGTKYLTGDINQDCYVDIGDLEYLARNWMKDGLGMDRPVDGNYLNTDENNWRYVCDVGPEIMIDNKIIQLDYNGDCRANLFEYQKIAENWLKCTDPANKRDCDKYWEFTKE